MQRTTELATLSPNQSPMIGGNSRKGNPSGNRIASTGQDGEGPRVYDIYRCQHALDRIRGQCGNNDRTQGECRTDGDGRGSGHVYVAGCSISLSSRPLRRGRSGAARLDMNQDPRNKDRDRGQDDGCRIRFQHRGIPIDDQLRGKEHGQLYQAQPNKKRQKTGVEDIILFHYPGENRISRKNQENRRTRKNQVLFPHSRQVLEEADLS